MGGHDTASVESVSKDLETSGTVKREEILNALQEILVPGSYYAEVPNEIKEKDIQEEGMPTL